MLASELLDLAWRIEVGGSFPGEESIIYATLKNNRVHEK